MSRTTRSPRILPHLLTGYATCAGARKVVRTEVKEHERCALTSVVFFFTPVPPSPLPLLPYPSSPHSVPTLVYAAGRAVESSAAGMHLPDVCMRAASRTLPHLRCLDHLPIPHFPGLSLRSHRVATHIITTRSGLGQLYVHVYSQ